MAMKHVLASSASVIDNADQTIASMWSKSPMLMLFLLIMVIPLLASFAFGFYVMSTYAGNTTKLTTEIEKQTTVLMDIKDELRNNEIRTMIEQQSKKADK